MSKSAPKAPNYEAAAEAQAQGSREVTEAQTWANRPDQNTPWGSTTWGNELQWDPSTEQYINRWTQNTTLDPQLQEALDAQIALQRDRSQLAGSLTGRMQDEYGSPMDWESIRAGGGDVTARNLDPSNRYYDEAGDAIYKQWESRALPQQARDTDALRTRLYNMGLSEGDPAFDVEMEKLRQTQGDQQAQATYRATIGAGEEAARMFGMDERAASQGFGQEMAASQYATQQRQQQFAEEMQKRGFSLNEINAIIHGQQVGMPQMPNFSQANRAEGVQSLQAAQMQGQADLDRFNAQQQAMQGMMSGIGSIAGGFMMG